MSGNLALLDVNVPMYAAGKAHGYKEPCIRVMAEIAAGRLQAAIDVEIIQEILYRYGALHQWAIAVSLAKNLLELVPTVYAVGVDDARLSVDLFKDYAATGASARDAVHVAVMQNRGLTEIISVDRHFDAFPGITRLDPKEI